MEKGKKIKTYVKNSHAYFTNAEGILPKKQLSNTITGDALTNTQNNICLAGPQSAAAITLQNVMKELHW